MRILIQNPDAKSFISGQTWCADEDHATEFCSVAQAEAFCRQQKFSCAFVVVKFKDASSDVRFPANAQNDAPHKDHSTMSLFCERYRCMPSEFDERVFQICLYRRVRVLAPVIRRIFPHYFEGDFAFIQYLGRTTGPRDAMHELAAFVDATHTEGGIARNFLGIGISARKVNVLLSQLYCR